MRAFGIDLEIIDGIFGCKAPGKERLVLGHEFTYSTGTGSGRRNSRPPDRLFGANFLEFGQVLTNSCAACRSYYWLASQGKTGLQFEYINLSDMGTI